MPITYRQCEHTWIATLAVSGRGCGQRTSGSRMRIRAALCSPAENPRTETQWKTTCRETEKDVKAGTKFHAICSEKKLRIVFYSASGCASSDLSIRLESESLSCRHSLDAFAAIVTGRNVNSQ
jgi:hypothetical protein